MRDRILVATIIALVVASCARVFAPTASAEAVDEGSYVRGICNNIKHMPGEEMYRAYRSLGCD